MDLQTALRKIDKHIDGNSSMPVVVDLPNSLALRQIYDKYNIGRFKFIDFGDMLSGDSKPQFEILLHKLSMIDDVVFLYGVSTYLKLLGEADLNRILKNILEIAVQRKLIVLTIDCAKYLKISDPRVKDSGRLIVVDDEPAEPVRIHFVSDELADYYETVANGINQLSKLVELSPFDQIHISSKYAKADFPDSLFELRQHDSAFEAVCDIYDGFANMRECVGKAEHWKKLLYDLKNSSWPELVQSQFGGENNLRFWIAKFPEADDYNKWLFFMAIKTCGVPHNDYLAQVAADCKFVDDLPKFVFNTILRYNTKEKDVFDKMYDLRKDVIKAFHRYHTEVTRFCQRVNEKGDKSIYYLTDSTQQEIEKIFEYINQYSDNFTRAELMSVLKRIYPDLYVYLKNYPFSLPLLDNYVNDYKYCKVINKIDSAFMSKVDAQAVSRDYNLDLMPRDKYVHELVADKAIAYFVDALGIEYLSYIQSKCAAMGLGLRVNVGRCELPSLTSQNKGFVTILSEKGIDVIDVKDLDEIKHGEIREFDFTKTKLPIYLYKELQIIDEILNQVSVKLNTTKYDRVFLISDHGASRLAVIHENENQWEMAEKGIHSGRCCPVSEVDSQPDAATHENGFWCLANYDRFKGGRKASVEVHGGASLEEVAVPVIEITKLSDRIDCQISDAFKLIYVSFKTKAKIRLYISSASNKLRILLNDIFYDAQQSDVQFYYDFTMPEIKKAGIYAFDVYDGDNIVAQNLSFEVKKEGSSERKLL